MTEFGKLIKELRMEAGMTQKELAERLSTTDTTISGWENDKRLPDIDNLRRLAEVFQITNDELLNPTETLEKRMGNSQPVETVVKEEKAEAFHFLKKSAKWRKIAIHIICACILLVIGFAAGRLYVKKQLIFIEARSQVDTKYGWAYEIIYCVEGKYSEEELMEHARNLGDQWKDGLYEDKGEVLFVASYYTSIYDIHKWDEVYFQTFTFKK